MRYWILVLAWLSGPVMAGVAEGFAAYQRGDYATAHKELSLAARQDHPVAQNILATMYIQGIGVPRDYRIAMDWLYRAQALGMPEAMFNLARMYEEGLGEPRNPVLALKYYREAAIAGFRPAIQRLERAQKAGEFGLAREASSAADKTKIAKAPQAVVPGAETPAVKARSIPTTQPKTQPSTEAKTQPRPAPLPAPALKLSPQLAAGSPSNTEPSREPSPEPSRAQTPTPVASVPARVAAPENPAKSADALVAAADATASKVKKIAEPRREASPPARPETMAKAAPPNIAQKVEQQVEKGLSNYLQRERVLYVGSTDTRAALASYLSALRGQLQRHLKATFAGQPEVSLIISVAIRRDGRVHTLELTQSAGQRTLERAVMARLRELKNLAPLPDSVSADYDLLDVSIRLPIE